MLVLARKVGQKIVIGDKIIITVIESRRGVVRLGFDGSKDVPIHRYEVFERLKALQKEERDPPQSDQVF